MLLPSMFYCAMYHRDRTCGPWRAEAPTSTADRCSTEGVGTVNRSRWIIVAAVAVVAVGAIIALGSGGSPAPGLIDNKQLRDLQADGARVIDVRTAGEFAAGSIAGAENVPVSEIEAAAQSWDPAAPLVLYCATGSRSADVASYLTSLGFTSVYDLSGGIAQWDGDMAGGAGSTEVAEAPTPSASGLPVMYEFYTDW